MFPLGARETVTVPAHSLYKEGEPEVIVLDDLWSLDLLLFLLLATVLSLNSLTNLLHLDDNHKSIGNFFQRHLTTDCLQSDSQAANNNSNAHPPTVAN